MRQDGLPEGPLRVLLDLLLPAGVRGEAIRGDLAEEFHARAASSPREARAWYRRQARSVLWMSVRSRVATGTLPTMGITTLEFRLGARMLWKYPSLTLVSLASMSVALAGVAGFVTLSANLLNPSLPLDEGDRIVALQTWDVEAGSPQPRVLHDFVTWRDELQALEGLSAFKFYANNLVTDGGRRVLVRGSAVTSSAFDVAGVPAALGRTLLPADELPGAPDVVVLGHALWRSAFDGEHSALGATVRLGDIPHTVVGVMPEGFTFPYMDEVWLPLREDPTAWGRLSGPSLTIFGRLRDGVTRAEAQAELDLAGERAAGESPETHAALRPRILSYPSVFGAVPGVGIYGVRFVLLVGFLLVCANVGALIVARNSTREAELAVRSALGAGRSRIVAQLFVESLVLATTAAAIALCLTSVGVEWVERLAAQRVFGWGLPFWWREGLAPGSVLLVGGLAVAGAAASALGPALRVEVRSGRTRSGAAMAGEVYLRNEGRSAWGVPSLIAVSIAMVAAVIGQYPHSMRAVDIPAIEVEDYLTAVLRYDAGPDDAEDRSTFFDRYWMVQEELRRRLLDEPMVTGVTFASSIPGTRHSTARIETDGETSVMARVSRVDAEFFATLGESVLEGRGLTAVDDSAQAVVLNRAMVEWLGIASPLGTRIRLAARDAEPGPWLEVVGVVDNLGMALSETSEPPGLYLPLSRDVYPVSAIVRVNGELANLTPIVYAATGAVDPSLTPQVRSLEEIVTTERLIERVGMLAITLPVIIVLLLAISSVHALMAFAVARRTREIGIRIALGASVPRVVGEVFAHAMKQVGVGVVAGLLLTVFLVTQVYAADGMDLVVGAGLVLVVASLLGAIGPVLRAIRVQPKDAIADTG